MTIIVEEGKLISVLIVDDSSLARKVLRDILLSSNKFIVVGEARNGKEAIEKALSLQPDLVTMDIEMPVMNGIDALTEIMKACPLPVVMVSAVTKTGSVQALEALHKGAVDVISKPESITSFDFNRMKDEIILKLEMAARAHIVTFAKKRNVLSKHFTPTTNKIVVIASSTGGPQALEHVLPLLPRSIPVPVLVVQHMPEHFTKFLAERLNGIADAIIKEAQEGELLRPGIIYFAPGNYHMELVPSHDSSFAKIHLHQEPRELGVRPNANRLFSSVAKIYKENTIGIVLTGMGTDATIGSREIKQQGGTILAQSEDTCVIYGMPKSIVDNDLADEIVPIDQMAVALLQLLEL